MNVLQSTKRAQVGAALVEGSSINATCRMTGVAKHTVLKLLNNLGCAGASYHDSHAPAMEAGLTDHVWTLEELLGLI